MAKCKPQEVPTPSGEIKEEIMERREKTKTKTKCKGGSGENGVLDVSTGKIFVEKAVVTKEAAEFRRLA